MKSDFQNCLDRGKIVPSSVATNLVKKELGVAGSDLAEAKDRLEHKSFKWCTVVSYYAMFHAARALLYSKGYKERSHRCLAAAIHELFAKPKIFEARLSRAFGNAMALREDADYADEYSEAGASEAFVIAGEFVAVAKKLLKSITSTK